MLQEQDFWICKKYRNTLKDLNHRYGEADFYPGFEIIYTLQHLLLRVTWTFLVASMCCQLRAPSTTSDILQFYLLTSSA